MRQDSLKKFQREVFELVQHKKKKKQRKMSDSENKSVKLPSIHQSQQQNETGNKRLNDFQRRIRKLQAKHHHQRKVNEKILGKSNSLLKDASSHGLQSLLSIQTQENGNPLIEKKSFHIQQKVNYVYVPQKKDKENYEKVLPSEINSFQDMSRKQLKKNPSKKTNLKRKFRIIAYAVFFSVFFPKYSKAFTVKRFDIFRKKFANSKNLKQDELEITETVNENFQNGNSKISKKKKKKKQVFVVRIDKTIQNINKTIDQYAQFLRDPELQSYYHYFSLCLPYNFIIDDFYNEKQLSAMQIHHQKGYSTHSAEVAKLLLMKNLFVKNLVKNFLEKKINEDDENSNQNIMNSLSIYYICTKYISESLEEHKNEDWKEKLKPTFVPKYFEEHLQFEQMEEKLNKYKIQNFYELLLNELNSEKQKIQKKLSNLTQEIFEKLLNYRKKTYSNISKEVLSSKLVQKPNSYFEFRKGEEKNRPKSRKQQKKQREKSAKSDRSAKSNKSKKNKSALRKK